MSSTTTAATVEKLRSLFAQFGLPDVLVSDSGPNFVSSEFKEFLHRNGVKQVTSAPAHPASNGLAERAVEIEVWNHSRLTVSVPVHVQEYSPLHHGGAPCGIDVGKAIAVSIGFT